MRTTDPHGWRRAVHLDRVAALLEPLDGLALSDREHAAVEWLAGWDISTIAPIVRLLHAARAAAPLTDCDNGAAGDGPEGDTEAPVGPEGDTKMTKMTKTTCTYGPPSPSSSSRPRTDG